MPTISVIVPVYKVEKYLKQCIDSILAQTFTDFELILVDDGSPDNCGKMCDEYAQNDGRIVVIHKKNGGLSSARNAGLDIAKGEFISFVDSDDFVDSRMLELCFEKMRLQKADMVVFGIAAYSECGGIQPRKITLSEKLLTQQEAVNKILEGDMWDWIVSWNKLYKKDLFSSIRFPEGFIHEDLTISHHIIGECNIIAQIPKVLYYYRKNPDSITNSEYSIRRTDGLSALADRISYSHEKKWNTAMFRAAEGYVSQFFDDYFKFAETEENAIYFRRMEKSLRIALPYILQCKNISFRQKLHLVAIRINPKLYKALKRLFNK